ncbi:hypothetical protein A0U93_13520 [Neoasaia chiangmaiensis]|uniref:Uncharacterized protein n=1 Tax=Neoasaia chiangmaiensis TaxID=320497 RepID=A0A1U9KSN5_9PROT|nr:hypothetical protein A0U93_13520 [Neoasaia chiangmaiensis]
MSDLDQIMRTGERIPLPGEPRPPRFRPFLWVAAILVMIAIGIEVFWPIPKSRPLPFCGNAGQNAECVKR